MGFQGANVVVTGGAGFIGSHLVEQLVESGAKVVIIDDLSTGRIENLSHVDGQVVLRQLDIRHMSWKHLYDEWNYDIIFHLAGNAYVPPSVKRPIWDSNINFGGTLRLLEAHRKMNWSGALIYASSAAVYGNPIKLPIHEDDPWIPISPYGAGKLAAERYMAVYSQLYNIKAGALRYFSLYGPRQRKQVIFEIIEKIKINDKELFIYGDGSQVRDFNYVEDAARAAIIVAENGRLKGEVYNAASGCECSIHELAETLCMIMGVHPKFVYSGTVRPGDPEKWTGAWHYADENRQR